MAAEPAAATPEPGNELAIRQTPVPAFLREVGVQFAEMVVDDRGTTARLVVIPDSVRAIANVIDPVTSLIQADPNWTPRISVVRLNPDAKNGPDFYEQAGGKLAPTKQALEKLRKAAGVVKTWTERLPREQLADGERLGYKAWVQIRRSDGTVEEYDADQVFVEETELEEITDGVRRATVWEGGQNTGKPKWVEGTPEFAAEVRKRWLKELGDCSAKTQSKAILRAIRSALQIQHTFTRADAAKPFLVVGFNYTPDDETAKREAAQAMALLYGGTAPAALPAAATPRDGAEDVDEPQAAQAPGGSVPGVDAEQTGGGEEANPQGPTAAPAPAEAPSDDDPPPVRSVAQTGDERQIAESAGTVQAPAEAGQGWDGVPIAEIAADGPLGLEWIAWALKPVRKWNKDGDDVFGKALDTYTRFFHPELHEGREAA